MSWTHPKIKNGNRSRWSWLLFVILWPVDCATIDGHSESWGNLQSYNAKTFTPVLFTGCSISTLQHSSGYFLLFRLILRNIHTTLEYWKLFLVLTKKTFFIPLVMAYFMWYPAINEVASKTQPLQSVCACLGTRTQLCSLLWSCFTFWHQLTKFLHQSKWRILCRITQ